LVVGVRVMANLWPAVVLLSLVFIVGVSCRAP
jgi:hypothetical protein